MIKFKIYANVSRNCDLGNVLAILYHKNKRAVPHSAKSETARAFTPLKSTLPLASVGISSTINI